ncbi:MAG: twin-arginine translocation signal domain-containing protein, partial [Chloroflexi bacterium]|nr:twin-arginine translocation signal domain-containing protein [Chloroflexota bacterium]
MAEISPVPNENLDSGQHLVTRRRLIKQAGAAGIALTALYVAPSFSSFGPKKAYAAITGVPPCDSDLCPGRKPAFLTMVYTGNSGDGSNSQTGGKAPVISGDPGG